LLHLVGSSVLLYLIDDARSNKNQVYNNPFTGLGRPWGFQEGEDLRFQDYRHMKVTRLSALRTGRLYPPGNVPDTHFCQRLSRSQGHSAAERITSMKNSNDTIGNRTCDIPACSAEVRNVQWRILTRHKNKFAHKASHNTQNKHHVQSVRPQ